MNAEENTVLLVDDAPAYEVVFASQDAVTLCQYLLPRSLSGVVYQGQGAAKL